MPDIKKAELYIKNAEVLQSMFNKASIFSLFGKPFETVGNSKVKVQVVNLKNAEVGTYDPATGYPVLTPLVDWVEREVSQDKGNALQFDVVAMGDAIVEGVATLHNRYLLDYLFPEQDAYGLGAISKVGEGHGAVAIALDTNNIIGAIIDARTLIANARFKTDKLVLLAKNSVRGLLQKATAGTARLIGQEWNKDIPTLVETLDGQIAIIPAVDALFPSGVDFILAHPSAITPVVRYSSVEIVKPHGHAGRLLQEEIGVKYDVWVEPGAEGAIVLCGAKPRLVKTSTTTAAGDKLTVVFDKGAVVRYTDTGTAPANAADGTAYPAGGITFVSGKTYKIVAFLNGVASEAVSVATGA